MNHSKTQTEELLVVIDLTGCGDPDFVIESLQQTPTRLPQCRHA